MGYLLVSLISFDVFRCVFLSSFAVFWVVELIPPTLCKLDNTNSNNFNPCPSNVIPVSNIVLNSIVFSALAKEIIFPKLIDLAPLLVELEIT